MQCSLPPGISIYFFWSLVESFKQWRRLFCFVFEVMPNEPCDSPTTCTHVLCVIYEVAPVRCQKQYHNHHAKVFPACVTGVFPRYSSLQGNH